MELIKQEMGEQQKERRKRETTGPSGDRVDGTMVEAEGKGYGVKKGTSNDLEDALICHSCGFPQRRVRKFLDYDEVWDQEMGDVNSEKFLLLKMQVEELVSNFLMSPGFSPTFLKMQSYQKV